MSEGSLSHLTATEREQARRAGVFLERTQLTADLGGQGLAEASVLFEGRFAARSVLELAHALNAARGHGRTD